MKDQGSSRKDGWTGRAGSIIVIKQGTRESPSGKKHTVLVKSIQER